jgi:hypothetical protein
VASPAPHWPARRVDPLPTSPRGTLRGASSRAGTWQCRPLRSSARQPAQLVTIACVRSASRRRRRRRPVLVAAHACTGNGAKHGAVQTGEIGRRLMRRRCRRGGGSFCRVRHSGAAGRRARGAAAAATRGRCRGRRRAVPAGARRPGRVAKPRSLADLLWRPTMTAGVELVLNGEEAVPPGVGQQQAAAGEVPAVQRLDGLRHLPALWIPLRPVARHDLRERPQPRELDPTRSTDP